MSDAERKVGPPVSGDRFLVEATGEIRTVAAVLEKQVTLGQDIHFRWGVRADDEEIYVLRPVRTDGVTFSGKLLRGT